MEGKNEFDFSSRATKVFLLLLFVNTMQGAGTGHEFSIFGFSFRIE